MGIVLAFIIALAFIEYKYYISKDLSKFTAFLILLGTAAGVFAAYIMYQSFFEREQQMSFAPFEDVILQRKQPDRSLIIPQIIGSGDDTRYSPSEVNLYLTNIGIVAEQPGLGEPILYIPYIDIQEMQTINKMLLKYIRIRYTDHTGILSEVLLYVGKDTDVWAQNIGHMMVGQI